MEDTTKPASLTASSPGFVVAAGPAGLLMMVALAGCGSSDTERVAVAVQLTVERAQLRHLRAEQEDRVRLPEGPMERKREQVPSRFGPGDFPTRPPEPRWVPTAVLGEEPPPRDPRPPFHGR